MLVHGDRTAIPMHGWEDWRAPSRARTQEATGLGGQAGDRCVGASTAVWWSARHPNPGTPAIQRSTPRKLPSRPATINRQPLQRTNRLQVIAVSAMEGVGVGEALAKYHRLDSTQRRIPFSNVRTLSNWVHHPVTQVGRQRGGGFVRGEAAMENWGASSARLLAV